MPRLKAPERTVLIDLEGTSIPAREGESVASALLAAGERVFSRSVKYHRPRGPFCMSAACSHCLMQVDGVPNVFTCRTPVRAGMRVERQNAYPSAQHDVFGALDWLFPKGMDHHAMFAGVPVAQKVMAKVARHLGGLGLLPEKGAPRRLPQETLRVEVAIAGAGPAGLAAARELCRQGVGLWVLDREDAAGGRLIEGAPGELDPLLGDLLPAVTDRLRLNTTLFGLFTDAEGAYLAAVSKTPAGARLLKVYARRFLLANGSHPTSLAFENNDAPGVMTGRAISRLVRREHHLPGETFALVGVSPFVDDLRRLVEGAGGKVAAVVAVDLGDLPLAAHGRGGVKGLSFRTAAGKKRKVGCDVVAVCLPSTPAYELARQGGAQVRFDPQRETFVVEADAQGRTAGPGIWAAGDLVGFGTIAQAAEGGAKAARSLLEGRGG